MEQADRLNQSTLGIVGVISKDEVINAFSHLSVVM
ncbi:hypothetical protein LCGC14_1622970 [marine sediment metagenome]|uniref:Uncharacterized protein n=1 Tax=marine sediment metagenome TaxID=412755 RepID=A0A0F9L4M1_9ZZZZ